MNKKNAVITIVSLILVIALGFTAYFAISLREMRINYEKVSKELVEEKNKPPEAPKIAKQAYQLMYKKMYVKRKEQKTPKQSKVVYLTFDDGPSLNITSGVLDVLKRYNVKATFFLVHNSDSRAKAIIRREIKEGHSVGIHSESHNYEKIYASVKAYLRDFRKMDRYLKKNFNYTAEIFRFPGGSVNGFNLGTYSKIVPEMYRRGYTFYDWNVESGDAAQITVSADRLYNNVINQCSGNKESIVLMHDSGSKENTLKALPRIIKTLKSRGYVFKTLDSSVKPVVFTNR